VTITPVSSDLEIEAVRASMEADSRGDHVGRGATLLFNRLRGRAWRDRDALIISELRLESGAARMFVARRLWLFVLGAKKRYIQYVAWK
jgi:hypothetical protein